MENNAKFWLIIFCVFPAAGGISVWPIPRLWSRRSSAVKISRLFFFLSRFGGRALLFQHHLLISRFWRRGKVILLWIARLDFERAETGSNQSIDELRGIIRLLRASYTTASNRNSPTTTNAYNDSNNKRRKEKSASNASRKRTNCSFCWLKRLSLGRFPHSTNAINQSIGQWVLASSMACGVSADDLPTKQPICAISFLLPSISRDWIILQNHSQKHTKIRSKKRAQKKRRKTRLGFKFLFWKQNHPRVSCVH